MAAKSTTSIFRLYPPAIICRASVELWTCFVRYGTLLALGIVVQQYETQNRTIRDAVKFRHVAPADG